MNTTIKTAELIRRVQVHGAEAARRLELTTQVPTQSVFVTSSPSKRIRVGKMEIRLQHVCQRKLGSSEFEVLKSATSSMPAWMSDALFLNERGRNERMAAHA